MRTKHTQNVTVFNQILTWLNFPIIGIDGLEGTKHICGIRIVGTRLRARKEDKVSLHIYEFIQDIVVLIFLLRFLRGMSSSLLVTVLDLKFYYIFFEINL